MPAVISCSQGHQWQPLEDGLAPGTPHFYCAVCGLIETMSQQAETILPTPGERTGPPPGQGGAAAIPGTDPPLSRKASAQAETVEAGPAAAGSDDVSPDTVAPALPPAFD